jgi:hypothetical protein
MNYYFNRKLVGIIRREEKQNKPRSPKDREFIANTQETLQYITLIRNIRANKLNEDVAAAAGLETITSTIGDELGRDATEEKASTSGGDSPKVDN